MRIESTKLKKGVTFKDSERIYTVLVYEHIKKGRGLANVRVKVKELANGSVLTKTFSSNEKVEAIELICRSVQFLYSDSEFSYFMNVNDYSQFQIKNDQIICQKDFLVGGCKVRIQKVEDKIVGVDIPKKVSLKVKYTESAVAGDTAGSATKEAEFETGLKIQVPLFVKKGDLIIINTERKSYVAKGRVQ